MGGGNVAFNISVKLHFAKLSRETNSHDFLGNFRALSKFWHIFSIQCMSTSWIRYAETRDDPRRPVYAFRRSVSRGRGDSKERRVERHFDIGLEIYAERTVTMASPARTTGDLPRSAKDDENGHSRSIRHEARYKRWLRLVAHPSAYLPNKSR